MLSRLRRCGATILRVRQMSTPASGPPPIMPNMSPEQVSRIEQKDTYLRNRHKIIEANISAEDRDVARRKRMIYRSKQRGWLEVDLLLGSWASENVPHLTEAELDEYDLVLAEETIDVFNYVSGKDPLPPHLENLGVMKKLQEYALGMGVTSPALYADLKAKFNLT